MLNVQPVTTPGFYAAVPAYLPLFGAGAVHHNQTVNRVDPHHCLLKRLKARGSRECNTSSFSEFFRFSSAYAPVLLPVWRFSLQRLFNHRGREDFFFFARTDKI